MGNPVTRVGVATLACAVLSGVSPAELQDASTADDIVTIDQPNSPVEELVRQVRRLSTNSTGDGISTGSWVAIIVGSVAVVVLVAGALWYTMCRKPPMYTPANKSGYAPMKGATPMSPYGEIEVPNARDIPPDFFRASAAREPAEMPLLRMSA